MKLWKTQSPEATQQAGRELAGELKPGAVLALVGGLGCGKTAFVQGIADFFGTGGQVSSPTYTLVNEYQGSLPLYHFDLYRLESPDPEQCDWIDDYLFGEGVCVIEWADRIREILPENTLWLQFSKDPDRGENYREIRLC